MKHSLLKVRMTGWIQLIAISLMILVVWGLILPVVNENPGVASKVIDLRSKGIDPSAMYYTDLDIAEEISFRVEHARNDKKEGLWK